MKKILLTLVCGFGLMAAFAQEPAKVSKKKAAKVQLLGSVEAAKAKAKEKEKMAMDAGKATPASSVKGTKATLAAETAN